MQRRAIVGVMGSGTDACKARATELGRFLAWLGVHLLTGGGGGVMSSVSRAFAESPERRGSVIGILPCRPGDPLCRPRDGYPNPWVEIPIATHLPLSGTQGEEPLSRNHINVLTSDAIVALPGGEGTKSEVALALRYRRPVAAYLKASLELPGLPEDVKVVSSIEEVAEFLQNTLDLT